MKEDFKYYVYKHTTPSNKSYIGITRQKPTRRWRRGKNYVNNVYFTRAINKYGWDNIKHEILFENLSKEEAEQKEIELIAYYKSNQQPYGYNIDNGGNSVGKMSEATKRKLSISHKGQKPHYVSNEEREIHRLNGIRNWQDTEIRNKITSKIITNHGVKVECIETGKVYNTLTEAQRDTGANRACIRQCCDGILNASNGLHWRYYNNIKTNDTTGYRRNNVVNKRKIKQYDLKGCFIKEYTSMTEASKETNINISKIQRNLKGIGLKRSQYIWKYSDDYRKKEN